MKQAKTYTKKQPRLLQKSLETGWNGTAYWCDKTKECYP